MGVPKLFKWLTDRYPLISQSGRGLNLRSSGILPPIDDFFIDANSIIHSCTHPEHGSLPKSEEEMFDRIGIELDTMVAIVAPRRSFYVAVDGVAPRAKLNQQRSRRFRAATEVAQNATLGSHLICNAGRQSQSGFKSEKKFSSFHDKAPNTVNLEDNKERPHLQSTGGNSSNYSNSPYNPMVMDDDSGKSIGPNSIKTYKENDAGFSKELYTNPSQHVVKEDYLKFDPNAITPGTPFMARLSAFLRSFLKSRMLEDKYPPKIIYSGQEIPGEGEHKIMDEIRLLRAQNTLGTVCIHGLDADLIMLSLATNHPHLVLLREQRPGSWMLRLVPKRPIPQSVSEMTFDVLHISILREYLTLELKSRITSEGISDFKDESQSSSRDSMLNEIDPVSYSSNVYFQLFSSDCSKSSANKSLVGASMSDPNHVKINSGFYAGTDPSIISSNSAVKSDNGRSWSLERIISDKDSVDNHLISDFVLLAMLAGNDFLPHLPGCHIDKGSLDLLLLSYSSNKKPDEFLTSFTTSPNHSNINWKLLAQILKNSGLPSTISHPELLIGSENSTYKAGDRKNGHSIVPTSTTYVSNENHDLSKRRMPLKTNSDTRSNDLHHELHSDDALVASPNSGLVLLLEDLDIDECSSDSSQNDESKNYSNYYAEKLSLIVTDGDFSGLEPMFMAYAKTLLWTWIYYYHGLASWTVFYPYHYAPLAKDFSQWLHNIVDENLLIPSQLWDKGMPLKPLEQLLAVLPLASGIKLLPQSLFELMSSEILSEWYPSSFQTDANEKERSWEYLVLIPFIDERRLLDAVKNVESQLTSTQLELNKQMTLPFTWVRKGRNGQSKHMKRIQNWPSLQPLLLSQSSYKGSSTEFSASSVNINSSIIVSPNKTRNNRGTSPDTKWDKKKPTETYTAKGIQLKKISQPNKDSVELSPLSNKFSKDQCYSSKQPATDGLIIWTTSTKKTLSSTLQLRIENPFVIQVCAYCMLLQLIHSQDSGFLFGNWPYQPYPLIVPESNSRRLQPGMYIPGAGIYLKVFGITNGTEIFFIDSNYHKIKKRRMTEDEMVRFSIAERVYDRVYKKNRAFSFENPLGVYFFGHVDGDGNISDQNSVRLSYGNDRACLNGTINIHGVLLRQRRDFFLIPPALIMNLSPPTLCGECRSHPMEFQLSSTRQVKDGISYLENPRSSVPVIVTSSIIEKNKPFRQVKRKSSNTQFPFELGVEETNLSFTTDPYSYFVKSSESPNKDVAVNAHFIKQCGDDINKHVSQYELDKIEQAPFKHNHPPTTKSAMAQPDHPSLLETSCKITSPSVKPKNSIDATTLEGQLFASSSLEQSALANDVKETFKRISRRKLTEKLKRSLGITGHKTSVS